MKVPTESAESKQIKKKLYSKQNCNLTQFPVIKLHILQNVQIVNLSHNFISDLKALDTHIHTSQHALGKLRSIDLSFNKLVTVQSLIPLALTASNLSQIKITDNPLTSNLNFLFEMILTFKKIKEITYTHTLLVNDQLRNKMIQFHLKGGNKISQFMSNIHKLTVNNSECLGDSKNIEEIQNLIEYLSKQNHSLMQQNDLIFDCIDRFCQLFRTEKYQQNQQTYCSPRDKAYIETYQQYEISANKNSLSRYLSSPDEQLPSGNKIMQEQWMHYYYQQMINNTQIQNKLLFQVQVSQEQNKQIQQGKLSFDKTLLSSILTHKWRSHSKLAYIQYPEIYNTKNTNNKISPFKSIHTQTSTHRASPRYLHEFTLNNYFFGFDRQWTAGTNKFIIHRFLSLLKTTIQSQKIQSVRNPQNLRIILQNEEAHKISSFDRKNVTSELNYHTFGSMNNQQNQFYRSPKMKQFRKSSDSDDSLDQHNKKQFQSQYSVKSALSPKSQNKYIIGTCSKMLEQIIKKMVFKRLCCTTSIKYKHIYLFKSMLCKIERHLMQIGFRNIFQESFFLKCMKSKLQKKKMARIFVQWKKIKKTKLKLLKRILNLKNKKQKAFLSVFITQWRIIGRNIKMRQILAKKQQELQIKDCPIAEMSMIMARSETRQNLNSRPARKYSKISERKRTIN